MSKILETIQGEINTFTDVPHELNPSFAQTQESILDLIDKYWMSKFREDTDGVFYNVIDTPTLVAMKQIDLDTKDIRVIAENENYPYSWFFEKELSQWMKENKIGVLLNDIVYNLPKYGHVILKRSGTSLSLVKISNLIVNPFAESIDDTPVIETHRLTDVQLLKMRDKGWEVADEDLELVDEEGKITIYERFDPREDKNNYHIVNEDGKTLFEGTKTKNPYHEVKWEKVPNRFLGRGNVERLFENQIAKNELENMLRDALQWSSKHIFQTRDETIARNLLTNVDNGEVLRVLSEVTPVANEERNLAAFNYADSKWNENTAARSFSDEVLQGKRPPAETPLGTTQLQVASAQAFFDMKREDLGLFLRHLLLEEIIPEFERQNRKEHTFTMLTSDKDYEIFERLKVANSVNKKILQKILKSGRVPTVEEKKIIEGVETNKLRSNRSVSETIPEGVYDNLDKKIDILITNEQIDLSSRLTTLQTGMQIIGANPSILQDPKTAGLMYEMFDLAGINPERMRDPDQKDLEGQVGDITAQRAGSIASPSVQATPAVASQVTGV